MRVCGDEADDDVGDSACGWAYVCGAPSCLISKIAKIATMMLNTAFRNCQVSTVLGAVAWQTNRLPTPPIRERTATED